MLKSTDLTVRKTIEAGMREKADEFLKLWWIYR